MHDLYDIIKEKSVPLTITKKSGICNQTSTLILKMFYMLTHVSGDDEWPLLGHYRPNTIITGFALSDTAGVPLWVLLGNERQEHICACVHVCKKCVGSCKKEQGKRSVSWKNSKDKRRCVMCHGGDHSSGCGEETAGRETPRERERERWMYGE